MLGFEWPAAHVIHYYKFVDATDFAMNAPCPKGSGGCADGRGVYTFDPFHQHELVHAYLWPFGLPLTVVMEGAAGSNCSVLEPFVVSAAAYETLAVAVPRGTSSWSSKLRFVDQQQLTLSRTSASLPSVRLLVCPDCDSESTRCQVLDLANQPVDVTWQGDYVLHIDTLSAQHADRIQIAKRN